MLDQLVADGLATYRDGKLSGCSLTTAGRAEHARLLAAELDGRRRPRRRSTPPTGASSRSTPSLLTVCTDWQLRDVDGESVGQRPHRRRLRRRRHRAAGATSHAEVEPICADLGAALDRFGGYGARLAHALERVRAGDTDWFTKPMIDSYHTVWFELHEDLLATLGIERGARRRGR